MKNFTDAKIDQLVKMIKACKMEIADNPNRNNEYRERDMWSMMKKVNKLAGLTVYK